MKPVNFILCDFFFSTHTHCIFIRTFELTSMKKILWIITVAATEEEKKSFLNIFQFYHELNEKWKCVEMWNAWMNLCVRCPQFKLKIPWIFHCWNELKYIRYLIKVTQTESQYVCCECYDDRRHFHERCYQTLRCCMHQSRLPLRWMACIPINMMNIFRFSLALVMRRNSMNNKLYALV